MNNAETGMVLAEDVTRGPSGPRIAPEGAVLTGKLIERLRAQGVAFIQVYRSGEVVSEKNEETQAPVSVLPVRLLNPTPLMERVTALYQKIKNES